MQIRYKKALKEQEQDKTINTLSGDLIKYSPFFLNKTGLRNNPPAIFC